ncbi:MAG: hypothetical protein HN350_15335 [Phycisphaerales bacterium]|nr:hypothetical protein [Phycisphaerales bacterium]
MIQKTEKSNYPLAWRIVSTSLLLLVSSTVQAGVNAPPEPTLGPNDGKLLVDLARSGMVQFIKTRTDAETQALGPALKHLEDKLYPVSVTLRSSGQLLARSYRADSNICRSVLSASLDAMRSGNLPDKVTPSVLAAMTVEVEVHGQLRAISASQLRTTITCGLTGLRVQRGRLKGFVLPSTATALGLSIEQMRQSCLAQLPQIKNSKSGSEAWSVFGAKHYVGYPDGKVFQLYRGKILLPPETFTEKVLLRGASTAGLFLVNSQGSDGAYRTSSRKAELHEHLHATYAMAKLAKSDDGKIFAASVNRALEYADHFVQSDQNQARILSKSSKGPAAKSPARATAWLLLTVNELPPDADNKALADKLARALVQDIVATVGPNHGIATPDQLLDWSVSLLALRTHFPRNADSAKLLAPLRKTVLAWSKSGKNLDPLVFRCLGGAPVLPQWRQIDDTDLPDRRGGFVSAGSEPTTRDTANAAVCLADSIASGDAGPERITAINKQILRARRFCAQMLYRSREAYWSDKPIKMIGGLRASPQSSAVSIEACATAIEAFLLN